MKKKFFLISLIILLTGGRYSYSQTQNVFSTDSLISELKTFYKIKNVDFKKDKAAYELDSIINDLGNIWISKIKKDNRIIITDVLNYHIKKRFSKDKTMLYFIKSVIHLNKQNESEFSPWISMINYMTNSSYTTSSTIEKFINDIYYLLDQDYLSLTTTTKWKITEGTYSFKFDSKNNKFIINTSTSNIESYSLDNDTIRIINTSGTYDIIESKWKGKKGKVTWEKYNYPSSIINVQLNSYSINMRKTEFIADSVTFTNKEVIDYPVLGRIHHKASLRAFKEGIYPQFQTYKHDYEIKSKLKNITFISGIEMYGKTLKYAGTDSIPAIAEYQKNGKIFLRARATKFSSLDNKLKSYQCAVTLYIANNDSITHPNIFLEINDNKFLFTRNPKGTGNRPFYNSYQKMYISVDNISWTEGDSLINFRSRLGNSAGFKSLDYFTKEDFTKHRMYETNNPLFQIKKYSKSVNSRFFYAQDYAAFVKQAQSGVIHRLMGLWYDGFIDYNPNTKLVFVNEKLFDYIKYFFDKKDYDVINITSFGLQNSQESKLFPVINAFFDIRTKQITLFGVDQVIINKRKKVGFVPNNKTFTIDKNRNMYFSGRLRVGLADFYGDSFAFNYDNYDINFTKSDSLVYRVWDKDLSESGDKMKAKYLTSTIEDVTGNVRIDIKSNKSGAKEISQFPKFTCSDTSYVYYDKRMKNGSVYSREDFYFMNFPFEHDSLLYIKKDELQIRGIMNAGIIFPKFTDTLRVQNDYSLGFLHKTSDDGIKLFNGRVSLSSESSSMESFIRLSNEGLQANGIAKWYNTTIATRDFNLYPDSLTALADEIEISELINEETYSEFPQVKGKLIETRWDAINDVVRYKTTGIPVDMYDERAKFSGTFEYSPKLLTGKGRATVGEGTVEAEDFTFNKNSFFSNKADIILTEKDSYNQDVIIKNMKSYVDINSSKAVFQSIEEEESYVNFVTNEYMSYPDHLVWHTDEARINLNYNMNKFTNPVFSKEEILLDSSYLIDVCRFDKSLFTPGYGALKFISTNIDQDSLMFFGSRANYNVGNKKLITKDVMRIIVADIVVTPGSDVVIAENGEMEKLLKTTVKARGLHIITEVDIKINSSKKYVASSGIYKYEDMNKELQNINFDNITYDQNKEATVAHGFIEQHEKFTLNPWFDYYGDVYFNATKDRLRFEGYAKLIHTCPTTPKWFYFKSDIDPDSVYLPLEPRLHSDIQINKARVYADIMSSKDSIHTFPVFLSTDPFGTSESILSLRDSSYYVTYDRSNNRYEITTLEKFNDKTLPGNYLDLKRSYCIVNGEGHISYSKSIKINDLGGKGNLRFDMNSGEVTMQTLTYLDFFFNKKSLDILTEKLLINTGLIPVKVNDNTYKKPMYELLGINKTDKMLLEMSENAGIPRRFPEELNKTLVFTNLNFKWDHISKSFKSSNKIGISNINNKMINKYVNGHIQIKKRRTGDKIYIYFETADKEWFFYIFSGGIMRTISSVTEYNSAIEELKTKDKRIKTEKGIFNYMMTNNETKNLFIYEFTGKHPAIDDFEEGEDDDDDDDDFED